MLRKSVGQAVYSACNQRNLLYAEGCDLTRLSHPKDHLKDVQGMPARTGWPMQVSILTAWACPVLIEGLAPNVPAMWAPVAKAVTVVNAIREIPERFGACP